MSAYPCKHGVTRYCGLCEVVEPMLKEQHSLASAICSPAHACTHNVAKGVECRKPATHRVTRDGDNSLEWFFCEEHTSQRKGHIYTVTALENS